MAADLEDAGGPGGGVGGAVERYVRVEVEVEAGWCWGG